MDTLWVDLVGYEGRYKINKNGDVLSILNKKQKILKPTIDSNGYLYLNLRNNGKTILCRIHRLLAITFIGEKIGYSIVNHINGLKNDNRLENLEWVTFRENVTHGFKSTKKSSKYPGVSFCKQTKKWKSCCMINGFNKTLGRFSTEEEARDVKKRFELTNNIKNKYS